MSLALSTPMTRRATTITLLAALFGTVITGCGYEGASTGAGPGDIGATPGGAQDIGYARQTIEGGNVPPSTSITAEGLLSEHDVPSDGSPCEGLLCARPSVAVAPSLDTGHDAYWVSLGLRSGIASSAGAFHRPPVDLVILIDHSESMVGDIDQTTEAVADIVDRLRPDDRLSVLAFNDSVTEVQPFGAIADKAALESRVRRIDATGGWNLDQGLTQAYDTLRRAGDDPARLRRVIVLSCSYPDNSPGADQFDRIVGQGATERIGLTFLGVLLEDDSVLAADLGRVRGGAYYFVEGTNDLPTFFDDDLDFMLSPLAYDLHFGLAVSSGFQVDRIFGIPGDSTGDPTMDVQTAFANRRGGTVLVRLRKTAGSGSQVAAPTSLGTVSLHYDPESAFGLGASSEPAQSLPVPSDVGSADGESFQGPGVRKAVFLVNEAERMITALQAHEAGDDVLARSILDTLIGYMRREEDAMHDPDLTNEVKLVMELRANLR